MWDTANQSMSPSTTSGRFTQNAPAPSTYRTRPYTEVQGIQPSLIHSSPMTLGAPYSPSNTWHASHPNGPSPSFANCTKTFAKRFGIDLRKWLNIHGNRQSERASRWHRCSRA